MVVLPIYCFSYLGLRATNIFTHYSSLKDCGWFTTDYKYCHRIEFRRLDCGMFTCILHFPIALFGEVLEIVYLPPRFIEGLYWQSTKSVNRK